MAEDNILLMQRMEAILKVFSEAENFGSNGGELSADELDDVLGGVTVPEFQQFLQYVQERNAKDKKNN